jgi:hypothetical protein
MGHQKKPFFEPGKLIANEVYNSFKNLQDSANLHRIYEMHFSVAFLLSCNIAEQRFQTRKRDTKRSLSSILRQIADFVSNSFYWRKDWLFPVNPKNKLTCQKKAY